MRILRETIRKMIMETCQRQKYWGIAAAGVVVICSEDSSVYLHHRHNGKWAYPGGGIHLGRERFVPTPIPEEVRLDPKDLRFRTKAIEELEEEAGYLGLPSYTIVDELITYEAVSYTHLRAHET